MATDTVLCSGCGITLRPFMTRCPRCGVEREAASAAQPAGSNQADVPRFQSEVAHTPAAPQTTATAPALQQLPAPAQTTAALPDDLRRRALQQEEFQLSNTVMMSPPDEVRRFPLFTRAQIILMLVGLGLLGLGLLIGYLLWSREKTDTSLIWGGPQLTGQAAPTLALPETSLTPDPSASPSPTPAFSIDDQVLFEEAKKVLAAYNPTGVARYKLTVKDGIVTLDGSAEHLPEKEGATNVLRLLVGAKQIVNNLAVKADLSLFPSPTAQPLTTLASTKASLNSLPTQANATLATSPTETNHSQQPETAAQRAHQLESEQLQREQEAARQREAEEKSQRETEEATRRQQQEEARRLEAERFQTRPRRAEVDALRSGTVAWSGIVDGVDEIVIGGGSAAVRHLSGEAVRDTRASFSTPVPRSPVAVKLLSTTGRGTIQIVQQPAAANGYTTIVRIDDSAQRGGQAHQFTLRWLVQ